MNARKAAEAQIIATTCGGHTDPVERRLRLRRVFVAGIALMVATVVTVELACQSLS
jgi:hypothetical protein